MPRHRPARRRELAPRPPPRRAPRQPARLEAQAGRARVLGLAPDRPRRATRARRATRRAARRSAAEAAVAAGAFGAEPAQTPVAPDDAAREQHRAAGPVALLQHERPCPSSRRRAAARGRPSRAGDEDEHSGQREARLVLDVLDPHAVRAPDEDGERVRRVDEVVDLDAEVERPALVLVGRVDEHGQMIQERPLRRPGSPGDELDQAPPTATRGQPTAGARPKPSRAVLRRGRPGSVARSATWSRSYSRSVAPRRDRADALAELEVRLALAPRSTASPSGSRPAPRRDRYPQRHVLERAAFPRAVGREERQLAAARVGADEVKRSVRSITCIPRRATAKSATASRSGPEGDMVERLRVHGGMFPVGRAIIRSVRSGRCSRLRTSR